MGLDGFSAIEAPDAGRDVEDAVLVASVDGDGRRAAAFERLEQGSLGDAAQQCLLVA